MNNSKSWLDPAQLGSLLSKAAPGITGAPQHGPEPLVKGLTPKAAPVSNEFLKEAQETLAVAQAEVEKVRAELESARNQIKQLESKITQLKTDSQEVQKDSGQVVELRQQLIQSQTSLDEAHRDLESARRAHHELHTARNQMETLQEELVKSKEERTILATRLTSEENRFQNEIVQLQQAMDLALGSMQHRMEDTASSKEKLHDLETEVIGLREKLAAETAAHESTRQLFNTIQSEYFSMRQELARLRGL